MQNIRTTYNTPQSTQSFQVTVTKKAANGAACTAKNGRDETQSVPSTVFFACSSVGPVVGSVWRRVMEWGYSRVGRFPDNSRDPCFLGHGLPGRARHWRQIST